MGEALVFLSKILIVFFFIFYIQYHVFMDRGFMVSYKTFSWIPVVRSSDWRYCSDHHLYPVVG